MSRYFGVFLMVVALAATFFIGALGTAFVIDQGPGASVFLYVWGLTGPVFMLGFYLNSGGLNLSLKAHLVFVALAAACILIGYLAA
jgi:hypothetical protein